MSRLRPELKSSTLPAISTETALYMIRDSVARRAELIHGRLHDNGGSCAIGAFFRDNPRAVLSSRLIDEVATYNDSIPPAASKKTRQRKVLAWLRWRLKTLAGGA
jgi:hypothetical protein